MLKYLTQLDTVKCLCFRQPYFKVRVKIHSVRVHALESYISLLPMTAKLEKERDREVESDRNIFLSTATFEGGVTLRLD